ncbi:MAG: hypothetical protein PHE12_03100, partial [Clostridia bacterium]|nr:hypothetical protein [Clostridia bacterium]
QKQQEFLSQGVSVEFSVIDGEGEETDNYYIENGIVRVDTLPQFSDLIYLKADFTFLSGAPLHIERLVRINYISATMIGGDEGADYYSSHVSYLNGILLDETAADGRTYTSFFMPSEIIETSGKIIGVEYELLSLTPNLSSGTSEGKSCLVYAENASTADSDYVIRIDSSGSMVYFEINIDSLKASETDIEIKYTFTSETEEGEPQSTTKDNYKGGVTLHGILRGGEGGDLPDLNLFNAALACYDTMGDKDDIPDGYITLYEAGLPCDIFTITDLTVNSFMGINYFTHTDEFVFDGTGNGAAAGFEPMDYLEQLENVKKLSLINNGINDGMLARFVNMRNLVCLNLSENLIADIGSLGSIYGGVKTLDLSYNNLTDLNGLERFVALNTLNIEGNEIENFRKLLDMPSMLDGGSVYYLYDGLTYQNYFDGAGKFSVTTFVLLTQRGVNIYYDGDIVEFSDEDLIKAVHILESIIISVSTDNKIILPQNIYYNGSNYYIVTWDLSQLSVVSYTGSDEITVTHNSPSGNYVIYASVTLEVEGVPVVTVHRPFYIEVLQ